MTYTQRFYRGEADYAAMHRLIADSYKLVGPHHYILQGDLDWWRAFVDAPVFMPTVPLWFAGETLVGFVWPGQAAVDLMLHPQHREAEPLMVAYAEEHFRKAGEEGEGETLMLSSLESDAQRNRLLAEQGFERSSDFLASHIFDFDGPPPAPQLPDGYTLRDMGGDADWEKRVALHRAAFHPSKFTLEKYQAARNGPTYRPDLDLVAVAPNGDYAAYTTVWFEEENRVALYEPVGCHPDYQRRGLGRAVLYEGLRRLYELGATRAHVGSWMDDSSGAQLYRAAGFHLINRWYEWSKTYPQAPAQDEAA